MLFDGNNGFVYVIALFFSMAMCSHSQNDSAFQAVILSYCGLCECVHRPAFRIVQLSSRISYKRPCVWYTDLVLGSWFM